ncbi:MAG: hypothetical protein AB1445_01905 [Bacillota bacterium]
MGEIHLPGLEISPGRNLIKQRRLPSSGEICVYPGQRVQHDTVVALLNPRGYLETVDVARILEIPSVLVPDALLRKVGDRVLAGEVIARYRSTLGLFNRECRAPMAGTLERLFPATGRVTIRSLPVALRAYVPGEVVRVIPGELVSIRLGAALVQGIFGVGGEGWGELCLVGERTAPIRSRDIGPQHSGKILVGGVWDDYEALTRVREVGAVAVITGGLHKRDLDRIAGRVIGTGVTGHEDTTLITVLTEGFGAIPMSQRTYRLVQELDGRQAAVSGATQVRAGVVRPEAVIPLDLAQDHAPPLPGPATVFVGTPVRIISPRHFGAIGTVVDLPLQRVTLETGSQVQVAAVRLDSGELVMVPRSNLELYAR